MDEEYKNYLEQTIKNLINSISELRKAGETQLGIIKLLDYEINQLKNQKDTYKWYHF